MEAAIFHDYWRNQAIAAQNRVNSVMAILQQQSPRWDMGGALKAQRAC